ncbi:hypothetical protein [Lysinibacillus xylanilyticus]
MSSCGGKAKCITCRVEVLDWEYNDISNIAKMHLLLKTLIRI